MSTGNATASPVRPRLLADREFRHWYAARVVSQTGGAASAVAIPILVYRETGSAALTASIAGLAVLPYLLFGLFAGALADRVDRKTLMVGADLVGAAALSTVVAAWAAGMPTIPHVLIVAFGVAACHVWFDAAAFGALPKITGMERLATANSFIVSSSVVIGIAIPAATGAVAAITSPVVILAADALTYLVSAAILTRLRGDLRADRSGPATGMRAEIAEGLRFVWRQPIIRALTFSGTAFAVSGGGVTALTIVHADEVLGIAAHDGRVGLVYSCAAVGAFLASVALPKASRTLGYGPVSVAGYVVVLAALPWLAVNTNFALALVLWLVWDAGHVAAITNGITVRQLVTPDGLQSRVNTTGRMIAWGGAPLGALLAGALAELVGASTTFLVLALPVLVGLIGLLASPVRTYRG